MFELLRLTLVLGLAVSFVVAYNNEFVSDIRTATTILCGDNTSFLYGNHPDHGLPVFTTARLHESFQCYTDLYLEMIEVRLLPLRCYFTSHPPPLAVLPTPPPPPPPPTGSSFRTLFLCWPTAANREPPTADRHQSATANCHQPPTADRQPPPTTNRRQPPTANCQPPPTASDCSIPFLRSCVLPMS